MALGNFAIQEILYGVAEDFSGNLLYTLDQLSSASIEISADPTEITDKNGNVIRQVYRSKTGTFTATSALLSPNILNAGSGSSMKVASSGSTIRMPKIEIHKATDKIDLTAAKYVATTVKVIEVNNNGSNGKAYTETDLTGSLSAIAADPSTSNMILDLGALPTADSFLVKFDRDVEKGEAIYNKASDFPQTCSLTLYAAVVDPCDDQPRAAYVVIPSFQPDPSVTISLDSENTEVDFTGQIQVNFCSDICSRTLYEIYFPEETAIVTATCED